jgi:hypothetical protein
MSVPHTPRRASLPDVSGIRRRQAAARRLPAMPDGRRDPIAPAPGPVQTLLQVQVGKRTVWWLGLDRRQAMALFKRAGVTRFMHDGRGWCTSIEDADDILTVADHGLHWRTTVTAVDR